MLLSTNKRTAEPTTGTNSHNRVSRDDVGTWQLAPYLARRRKKTPSNIKPHVHSERWKRRFLARCCNFSEFSQLSAPGAILPLPRGPRCGTTSAHRLQLTWRRESVGPSDQQMCQCVRCSRLCRRLRAAVTGSNHCRSKRFGAKGCANAVPCPHPRSFALVLVQCWGQMRKPLRSAAPECSCCAAFLQTTRQTHTDAT